MSLEGKVALVIGGGRGIGAASASLLAERGASVVINYRLNNYAAEQLVETITEQGKKATAVCANVHDPQECAVLVNVALEVYGRIDILVDSASAHTVFKPFSALNWEEFSASVTNELRSSFEITKAVLPVMQQQHYGRIIYIGSGLAKHPGMTGAIGIGVGKAGLVAFTRYIAKEYAAYGITANVVAPSLVETELSLQTLSPEFRRSLEAATPLGRIAQPEDIAGAVAFFASDDSGFMTGLSVPVNGGTSME